MDNPIAHKKATRAQQATPCAMHIMEKEIAYLAVSICLFAYADKNARP